MSQLIITTQGLGIQEKYPVAYIKLINADGTNQILLEGYFNFGEFQNRYDFIDNDILFQNPSITNILIANVSTHNQLITPIIEYIGIGAPAVPVFTEIPNGYQDAKTQNFTFSTQGVPEVRISLNALPTQDYNQTTIAQISTLEGINILQLSSLNGIASGLEFAQIENTINWTTPQYFNNIVSQTFIQPNPYYLPESCNPLLENVELCIDENAAGTGQYVNIIPVNDLSAMPSPYNVIASLSNSNYVTAVGVFEYVPDKKFTRFQTLHDSRLFDLSSDGTVGQLRPKGSFTFRLQHSKAALGALKKMANERLILVFQNARNEKIIIGTLIFPAQITAYNATLSDKEGFIEITVQNSIKMPLYYSGNL